MNKEETLARIEALPEFKFRDVAVQDQLGDPDQTWIWDPVGKKVQAITESTNTRPLAFVSNRYKLVQMKQVFKPIVEPLDIEEAKIIYHDGFSIMDVFPSGNEYKITDSTRVGISTYNSVDRTCAVNIKFCIREDGRLFTVPKKIAAFRKVHMGNVAQQTKDYSQFMTKIKDSWLTVVTKFKEYKITPENYEETLLAMDQTKEDWPLINIEGKNLWELAMLIYDKIDNKGYKTDIHTRKHKDSLVENIFLFGVTFKITGGD